MFTSYVPPETKTKSPITIRTTSYYSTKATRYGHVLSNPPLTPAAPFVALVFMKTTTLPG